LTSEYKVKNAPDGPLYIVNNIYDKPTNGILIYTICGENIIKKEFLVVHELYQDTYDKTRAWIKTQWFFFPYDRDCHPTSKEKTKINRCHILHHPTVGSISWEARLPMASLHESGPFGCPLMSIFSI
jgi:hypothetical protein